MRVLVTGGSGFIGVNVIAALKARGAEILNIDTDPPCDETQAMFWRKRDIRDRAGLADDVRGFAPTHVVHLAALATFHATKAELMSNNVDGTVSLLEAVHEHAPRARLIVTSTQYVNGPGSSFDNDMEFHPVNDYGESKIGAERAARDARYAAMDWVIVRPTNIWGPFHPRFPTQIWKYIRQGFYMHPGHRPIVRAYGYVGNVVRQIEILLDTPVDCVRHKVFYLTDPSIDSYELLNQFSLTLRGRPLTRVPHPVLKLGALVGDLIQAAGFNAPFRSDRLHRMTTGHLGRYEKIWEEFGYQPISLSRAVEETKAWLVAKYPQYYR
jgi:nucleoside-diphosphate-sugar epimerase